jgi:hypothetical protein
MALGRGRRVEHDADDAQEGIVFDDEDRSFGGRHGITAGAGGIGGQVCDNCGSISRVFITLSLRIDAVSGTRDKGRS